MQQDMIVILDLGSEENTLIAFHENKRIENKRQDGSNTTPLEN